MSFKEYHMSIVASSLGSSLGEKMVAFLWGFFVMGEEGGRNDVKEVIKHNHFVFFSGSLFNSRSMPFSLQILSNSPNVLSRINTCVLTLSLECLCIGSCHSILTLK